TVNLERYFCSRLFNIFSYYHRKKGDEMRIKVVNLITDIYGDQIPSEMLGKEYEVLKEDVKGVWVREGKFDVLVHFEELEISNLSDCLSNVLLHYLRHVSRENYHEDIKSIGCNHLL
ncbi:hypothetical protein NXY55_26830, partial [Aeromonas veronii]|nr:hypothetical protein [Aeromonas veronii]